MARHNPETLNQPASLLECRLLICTREEQEAGRMLLERALPDCSCKQLVLSKTKKQQMEEEVWQALSAVPAKADLGVFIAVMDPLLRFQIWEVLKKRRRVCFPVLADPDCCVDASVNVPEGTLLFDGCRIGPGAVMGSFCMVDDAVVDARAVMGSFVTLSSMARIHSCAHLRAGCWMQAGSQLLAKGALPAGAIAAPSSMVFQPWKQGRLFLGNPAQPILITGLPLAQTDGFRSGLTSVNQPQASSCAAVSAMVLPEMELLPDPLIQKELCLLGAGGHGLVTAGIAAYFSSYCERIGFLDDHPNGMPLPFELLGNAAYPLDHAQNCLAFPAIGRAEVRRRWIESWRSAGGEVPTLIHPRSSLDPSAVLYEGVLVMAEAAIQANAQIGPGCIINTGATIDHECILAPYVHVAVGAHLAGNVHVGTNTWIGAGAVVKNNVTIGADIMIGAGAVVVCDLSEPGTYIGVPARKQKKPAFAAYPAVIPADPGWKQEGEAHAYFTAG